VLTGTSFFVFWQPTSSRLAVTITNVSVIVALNRVTAVLLVCVQRAFPRWPSIAPFVVKQARRAALRTTTAPCLLPSFPKTIRVAAIHGPADS
jgi:hypothetical protein